MCLELLKPMMGINARIGVIETDHESNGNVPALHVVDEAAAEFLISQRPTHRVKDPAGSVLLFWHVPDFFDADGIHLGILSCIQAQSMDQLFGERASHALSDNRDLRANLVCRLLLEKKKSPLSEI